jgi:hypothetical protein
MAEENDQSEQLEDKKEENMDEGKDEKMDDPAVKLLATMGSKLECGICQSIFSKPCTLSTCGHSFCQSCWEQWCDSKASQNAQNGQHVHSTFPCPFCRKPNVKKQNVNMVLQDLLTMVIKDDGKHDDKHDGKKETKDQEEKKSFNLFSWMDEKNNEKELLQRCQKYGAYTFVMHKGLSGDEKDEMKITTTIQNMSISAFFRNMTPHDEASVEEMFS